MKFADINRQFTEIAESYLDHGYHINTATMGPSSGEVAHLDLTNGSVVIRIVLQSFFKDDDFYNEGYELIVGSANEAAPDAQPSMFVSIWNNRLHVVERHKFFCTGSVLKGKHHGERFYGTRDEAEAAAKTRSDRAVAIYMSACPSVMTSRAAKIAERYISRVTGIKHPNRANLNVRHAIRRDDRRVYGQYIVTYNGKSYILH